MGSGWAKGKARLSAGLVLPLSLGAFSAMAAGDLPDLSHGKWVLCFLVFPGCPACEEVLGWLGETIPAFPELRFLTVVLWGSEEVSAALGRQDGLGVFADQQGFLAAGFQIKRAPTLVLLAGGQPVERLDWPFSQPALLAASERLARLEVKRPQDLVGLPPPGLAGTGLTGAEITLEELPRPVLLVFFNPNCPPCWETLSALESRPVELSLVLVVAGGMGAGRARLEAFSERTGALVVSVEPQVVGAWHVRRTPTFFLVGGEGVIVWAQEGFGAGEQLDAALAGIFGQGESSPR